MSWFTFGEYDKKDMIGVWVRHESNDKLFNKINDDENKGMFHSINRVIVKEFVGDDKVTLEVWCKNFFDLMSKKNRYRVFYITLDIDNNWICEGDLGQGINLK